MNSTVKNLLHFNPKEILSIADETSFLNHCLAIFKIQYAANGVYRRYCEAMNVVPSEITQLHQIPFLPVSFFKSHEVKCQDTAPEYIFYSSGTQNSGRSKHLIFDLTLYEASLLHSFRLFYGDPEALILLAVLPSYLDNKDSSLVYMTDVLIRQTLDERSGFVSAEEALNRIAVPGRTKKILLVGVSFALMDLAEMQISGFENVLVMETGGMKGRRTEIPKQALHDLLKAKLGVAEIHSEYGMTELLSQAYATGGLTFRCPPWMKVLFRNVRDPLSVSQSGSGAVNVIDLMNVHTCSFIATDDLGQGNCDGFEILGRMDNSEMRGCNLLSF